jgi:hypothetical protein
LLTPTQPAARTTLYCQESTRGWQPEMKIWKVTGGSNDSGVRVKGEAGKKHAPTMKGGWVNFEGLGMN